MAEKSRRFDLVLQDRIRKGLDGDKKVFSISLMYETWALVNRVVETGAGKYGSAFIDHATRFLLACLAGDPHNLDVVIEEMQEFIVTPNFSTNLRRLAKKWDEKRGNIEL